MLNLEILEKCIRKSVGALNNFAVRGRVGFKSKVET